MTQDKHGFALVSRLAIVLVAIVAVLGVSAEAISDKALIDESYYAWEKTVADRDIDAWSTYLAPQAVFMPPDAQVLEKQVEIIDYYRKAFADSNFSLNCEQWSVDVAESGELAWSTGICHATFSDENGDKASGSSRWFKIWEKRADGAWRCRMNTWDYIESP
jgi:ketosteroid isomerase-like protein